MHNPRINPQHAKPERAKQNLPSVALARGHHMAYQALGQPGGEAWLVLHGGPGSGAQASMARSFPAGRKLWLILPDQRGAGLSWPRAGLAGQSLPALAEDLERLRTHLGIARWNVLGGSWGATLGLAYAARYPHAVLRLVMRGFFDGSSREVSSLFRRFWPGVSQRCTESFSGISAVNLSRMRPSNARAQMRTLLQVFRRGAPAVTAWNTARLWDITELRAALHGQHRALLHSLGALATDDPTRTGLAVAQRRLWSGLQRQMRRTARQGRSGTWPIAPGQLATTRQRRDAARWQKFRIQGHWLARLSGQGNLPPGELARCLARVAEAGITTDWVHGNADAICRPARSRQGHQSLLARGADSRLHLTRAGHLGTEPDTERLLRQLTAPR